MSLDERLKRLNFADANAEEAIREVRASAFVRELRQAPDNAPPRCIPQRFGSGKSTSGTSPSANSLDSAVSKIREVRCGRGHGSGGALHNQLEHSSSALDGLRVE